MAKVKITRMAINRDSKVGRKLEEKGQKDVRNGRIYNE